MHVLILLDFQTLSVTSYRRCGEDYIIYSPWHSGTTSWNSLDKSWLSTDVSGLNCQQSVHAAWGSLFSPDCNKRILKRMRQKGDNWLCPFLNCAKSIVKWKLSVFSLTRACLLSERMYPELYFCKPLIFSFKKKKNHKGRMCVKTVLPLNMKIKVEGFNFPVKFVIWISLFFYVYWNTRFCPVKYVRAKV